MSSHIPQCSHSHSHNMRRWQYGDTIDAFLALSPDAVMGELANASGYSIEPTQRRAWHAQIEHLQANLQSLGSSGKVYFEFDVPRMGKRIDAVVVTQGRATDVPEKRVQGIAHTGPAGHGDRGAEWVDRRPDAQRRFLRRDV